MDVSCSTPADWQHLQSALRARLLLTLANPKSDPDRVAQLRQALWNVQEVLRLEMGDAQ